MGYITNKFIIVSSQVAENAQVAREAATEFSAKYFTGLGTLVSDVIVHPVNGGASFFVSTDGSKLGWPDRTNGDAMRAAIIEYLRANASALYLDWVMIEGGGDDGQYAIEEQY